MEASTNFHGSKPTPTNFHGSMEVNLLPPTSMEVSMEVSIFFHGSSFYSVEVSMEVTGNFHIEVDRTEDGGLLWRKSCGSNWNSTCDTRGSRWKYE